MKINKLLSKILIVSIFYGCIGYKETLKHYFNFQVMRLITISQICNDIKNIHQSKNPEEQDLIIKSESINLIYLKENRIIQYKQDSLYYNSKDSSLSPHLKSEEIRNWEDSLSFKNSLILVKIFVSEYSPMMLLDSNNITKNCYVGTYNFDGEKLNIKDSLTLCKDSYSLADSSIWSKPVKNISEIKTRMKGKQFGNF
jgi:hypothetical protein